MTTGVLILVTHLLGVGHYARAAAIGRFLATRGHDVTLVSGGRPAPLVPTLGVRLVQLPSLHIVGTDFSAPLDEAGTPASPALLATRRALVLATLAETRPAVVVTELFPFGRRQLAGEFMALVEAAHRLERRPAVLASVRDILVKPAQPKRIEETHERLRRFYDGVLVHGDPALAPLEASWPLDEALRPLIRYTGYVHDRGATLAAPQGEGEIVVSGGGGDAGLALFRAALGAAALMPERRWRILLGGGLAGTAALGALPANVVVEPARADFPDLLARCAVSVSQAGYNTVLDVVAAGARAVITPFEDGRETEQRERAERFAARGLLAVLPAERLTPAGLATAVRGALTGPKPDPSTIDMDGLAATARLIERFAADRSGARTRTRGLSAAASARIAAALGRAADEGRQIEFWWRDDDVVAPSPALDRVLALARRTQTLLALAAIPAMATPALVDRLAQEPLACVLVHGLRHANHAPAGEKKAEFGPHRPLVTLIDEAACGLRRAQELFGPLIVKTFVPPWNRLAGDLASALPGLGYGGLSTFGPRRAGAPGLAQVNTHLDPIDWHGTRGLADEDRIVAALLAAIARPDEPIGLLTHHLVHDEATWAFCEGLLTVLAGHRAVRMTHARHLFRPYSGRASTRLA